MEGAVKLKQMLIYDAIRREREFQDQKYGSVLTNAADPGLTPGIPPRQGPGGHELPGWLIVIEKELAEAKAAATGHGIRSLKGRHSTRAEILQIAAVCVAALEQHGLSEDA